MSKHLDRAMLERFDAMDAVEREPLLRHAASCTACRRALIEHDPTRLFSLIGVSAVPGEALERLSRAVAREIDRESEGARARRRRYDRGALAASLALGLAIGSYLWMRPADEAWRAEDTAPRRLAVQPAEREFPGGAFEILSSPGEAQVLDLSVGETQIVMIFDEELEI